MCLSCQNQQEHVGRLNPHVFLVHLRAQSKPNQRPSLHRRELIALIWGADAFMSGNQPVTECSLSQFCLTLVILF